MANNRSIAWGIARAARAAGAELAFTFQGEALEKRVRPLAQELGAEVFGHCDVTDGASIDAVFAAAEKTWGALDFVVHCIAFSDKDQLTGRYIETTEDNFTKSLAISCYSFTAIAQRAEKLMPNGGAMLTLTYYGAEKWMPHYNVMGVAKAALEASVRYLAADLGEKDIRVNAISAGPIKTLAASGIGDFRYILKWNEYNAPLRRSVTIEEVGEFGGLSAVADGARRDRRDPACRRRLSCRRHEEPDRAGHLRRQGRLGGRPPPRLRRDDDPPERNAGDRHVHIGVLQEKRPRAEIPHQARRRSPAPRSPRCSR